MSRLQQLVPRGFLRWLAVLWLVCLAGCDETEERPRTCLAISDCPSGYHCGAAGVCLGDVGCSGDDQCCAGERCEDQRCRPRQNCSVQSPCGEPGTSCLNGLCVPSACGQDSECAAGQRCWWGRCGRALPCGGQCEGNSACSLLTNRCLMLRAKAAACPTGRLRVLVNDVKLLPEGCAAIAEITACRDLPPVPEGERGIPGVALGGATGLWHVSYDRTYGDVVLARHAGTPPYARTSLQALSGVPAGAPVLGAPSGPRGGVRAPGPDRGSVLAAVLGGERLHVAYRDVSASELRYLQFNPGQAVRDTLLATGPGVGTALAVALTPGGLPVVLAFVPARPGEPSRLHLHEASVAEPTGPGHWQTSVWDTEPAAAAQSPCAGACPNGQVCAFQGDKQACVVPATSCALCLPSQVCVGGKCLERSLPPPPLADLPQGRGAWLDLAILATGEVRAAAYSPGAGDLAIYRRKAGAAVQRTLVLAAAIAGGSNDFGRFVRLAKGDGPLWAACEDSQRGRLLLVREVTPAQGTPTLAVDVVDDGTRSDGHHRVGADVALLRHPAGGLLATYQDARRGDLLVATVAKVGGKVERSVLAQADSAGFSTGLLALGSKAFVVVSTTVSLRPDGEVRSQVLTHSVVWGGN